MQPPKRPLGASTSVAAATPGSFTEVEIPGGLKLFAVLYGTMAIGIYQNAGVRRRGTRAFRRSHREYRND